MVSLKKLETLDDYKIIKLYKVAKAKQRIVIFEYVYLKYTPLIISLANKFYNLLNSKDNAIGFEDLTSMYSEWIPEILNRIDLEKVIDTDSFRLSGYLVHYLTYFTNNTLNTMNEPTLELTEEMPEVADYRNFYSPDYYEEVERLYDEFLDECTDEQRTIIEMLRNGEKIETIKDAVGYNYASNIYYQKKIAERKFLAFFKKRL